MMFLALKESVFFTMFEIHTNVRIFITLSFVSPSRYLWIITLYKVNRCLAKYSPPAEKCFFWPKMGFNPKNHPKFLKTGIYLGKGNFFLWTTFSGRGQNMVNPKKWVFVFAQNIDFWPKNPIFAIRPQLWSMTHL